MLTVCTTTKLLSRSLWQHGLLVISSLRLPGYQCEMCIFICDVCRRRSNLVHDQWLVNTEACSANDLIMFRCSPSVASLSRTQLTVSSETLSSRLLNMLLCWQVTGHGRDWNAFYKHHRWRYTLLDGRSHDRTTGCRLQHGITQCYLPPDTSERTPPYDFTSIMIGRPKHISGNLESATFKLQRLLKVTGNATVTWSINDDFLLSLHTN